MYAAPSSVREQQFVLSLEKSAYVPRNTVPKYLAQREKDRERTDNETWVEL